MEYFDFSQNGRSSSGGSYGGLTKGEHAILKEERQQQFRSIDIEIEDIKVEQKMVERDVAIVGLESSEIGLEIAEAGRDMRLIDLQISNIDLQSHEIGINTAQERLTQAQDSYSYEKFNTQIKREQYAIQANRSVAELEAASQELDEFLDLKQLQHVDYNPDLNQLGFSESSLMDT